ncbi:hypothetical protein DHD05_18370 [Arenibacter sp. N53]|uniref:hypothetical protein n=1 Tax=Arenibacter TaxID=178469 RepID=UPI000CD3FE8A|nr:MULTISPECIES: hypothetical protein [Arenibacter]MCM4153564.1 hypothetical protein [Arenibacter sp. N53]
MERAYRHTGYFMLLLVPMVLLGFYKTYFSQLPDFNSKITWAHHLHAAIASVWIMMLILQPLLISNRKFTIHKMVGRLSYVVFPLLILSFLPMIAIKTSAAPAVNIFVPISDCIILTLLYSLAIYHRRKMSYHMRYMIGTAIVFLGPTFGRIGALLLGLSERVTQNVQYTIIYLILLGLIGLDKKHHKDFRPYLLMLIIWIVHQIIFNLLFGLR